MENLRFDHICLHFSEVLTGLSSGDYWSLLKNITEIAERSLWLIADCWWTFVAVQAFWQFVSFENSNFEFQRTTQKLEIQTGR